MADLGTLYPREIALLDAIMTQDRRAEQGIFSMN